MEENYLYGLILCFVFGIVFFKKNSEIDLGSEHKSKRPNQQGKTGSSGVDRYIQKNQVTSSENELSGVAKYLAAKVELEVGAVTTGVAKYLAGKEKEPVSGVSKYMARQVIQAKKKTEQNKSGVEKYLSNRG